MLSSTLTLQGLNDQLETFVDDYNNTEHGATKETPYQRYRKDLSCVRPAPDRLLDYFRRREQRRVKKDRTVQVKGLVFEVSAKLIDKTVDLLFHDDAPSDIEVVYQGLTYGRAVPLDLAVNAKVGRDWGEGVGGGRKHVAKSGATAPIAPVVEGGKLFDVVVYEREEELF